MEETKNSLQNNSLSKSNYSLQIKQSNFLTGARHDMNATEQNLMYMVMGQIRYDDPEDALYTIQLKKLEKLTGKQINYKHLISAFAKLKGTLYKVIDPDEVSSFAALTGVMHEPGSGVILVQLSSKIRKYLFDLQEQYTLFKFKNVLKLKSKYSKRMYEMLSQFKEQYQKQKEKNQECIINISVQELKWRFKLIDSATGFDQYPGFGEFDRNVLKPAFKEINGNTEISFEYKPIEPRSGRKIKNIALKINDIEERKSKRPLPESDLGSPKILTDSTQKFHQPLPLAERLHKKCEIDPDDAKQVVQSLPAHEIEHVMDEILKKYEAGDIKSLGGYSTKIFKAWLKGAKPTFEKSETPRKYTSLKSDSQTNQVAALGNAIKEKLTNEFGIKYPKAYPLIVNYGVSLDELKKLQGAISIVGSAIEMKEIDRNPEAIFEALISLLHKKEEHSAQSMVTQGNKRSKSVNTIGSLVQAVVPDLNRQMESAEEEKVRREKTAIWEELLGRFEIDDEKAHDFVEEYCVEALNYAISKVLEALKNQEIPNEPIVIEDELRKHASLWKH